jgi:nitroreductase
MTSSNDDRLGFIFGRRSIRAYTPQAVSDEAVQKLLEAAMAAPSAAATDPWRFVVVKNRGDALTDRRRSALRKDGWVQCAGYCRMR